MNEMKRPSSSPSDGSCASWIWYLWTWNVSLEQVFIGASFRPRVSAINEWRMDEGHHSTNSSSSAEEDHVNTYLTTNDRFHSGPCLRFLFQLDMAWRWNTFHSSPTNLVQTPKRQVRLIVYLWSINVHMNRPPVRYVPPRRLPLAFINSFPPNCPFLRDWCTRRDFIWITSCPD